MRKGMLSIPHWIGGAPSDGRSGQTQEVFNPATGQVGAHVSLGGPDEVAAAVSAADEAFPRWADTSASARSRILFRFRELIAANVNELASLITSEHGKVLGDAKAEVLRGLEVVEFACGLASLLKGEFSDQVSTDVDTWSFRQPLGVVAGVTPFNFPAMVPLWMFPLAIAAGNTFVLKPSEQDPSVSIRFAELWSEAGLPDGVFNVVQGAKSAVDALLQHPLISAISFVGSTPVARYVYERARGEGKRVQALGGAKNHAVVSPDADPEYAAAQLTAAAFGSAGQRCMAVSVAILVGDAAEPTVEALAELASAITVGPGFDPRSQIGPVITSAARDRIQRLIARAESEGAEIVIDGRDRIVAGHEGGFFLGPTIVDHVSPSMDVYQQEVFGPVLSTLRTETTDRAIALVNANPYGNGTTVFTQSGRTARDFSRRVTAGMVGINVPVPVPMAHYSFGGWKDSLFGEHHVHGSEGVRFYTRSKVVTARWPEGPRHAEFDMPTAT